jgi:hypothetical protein
MTRPRSLRTAACPGRRTQDQRRRQLIDHLAEQAQGHDDIRTECAGVLAGSWFANSARRGEDLMRPDFSCSRAMSILTSWTTRSALAGSAGWQAPRAKAKAGAQRLDRRVPPGLVPLRCGREYPTDPTPGSGGAEDCALEPDGQAFAGSVGVPCRRLITPEGVTYIG